MRVAVSSAASLPSIERLSLQANGGEPILHASRSQYVSLLDNIEVGYYTNRDSSAKRGSATFLCRFDGVTGLRALTSRAELANTSRTCNSRSGEPQSLQKTCSTGKIEIIPGFVAATNSRNPLEKFSGSNVRYTSSMVLFSAAVPMASPMRRKRLCIVG
jgi:hypothetical protein